MNTHSVTLPAPSFPRVRLYEPDAFEASPAIEDTRTTCPGVPTPDATWTLRRLYEALILPDLTADQRGTKEAFRGALNHWESRTPNPGIGLIDDETGKTFKRSMQRDPKREYSPETIRKQWRYLSHIMREAKLKQLIREVPRLRKLATVEPGVRIVSDDFLNRLYVACETATWPQLDCMTAPHWWQGSLVMWRIYGPRCCELHNRLPWKSERTKHDISRKWPSPGIYRDAVCPMLLVQPLGIMSRLGWLVYTPKKQSWAKPSPLVLPLHPVARAHLDRIEGPRQFIFPRSKANKAFNAQWKRLLEEAGIPEDHRFTRHDLRRTCEDGYGNVGAHITGHAKRSVSKRYYRQYLPRMARAIAKVKLPSSFTAILGDSIDERQKKLFE